MFLKLGIGELLELMRSARYDFVKLYVLQIC